MADVEEEPCARVRNADALTERALKICRRLPGTWELYYILNSGDGAVLRCAEGGEADVQALAKQLPARVHLQTSDNRMYAHVRWKTHSTRQRWLTAAALLVLAGRAAAWW